MRILRIGIAVALCKATRHRQQFASLGLAAVHEVFDKARELPRDALGHLDVLRRAMSLSHEVRRKQLGDGETETGGHSLERFQRRRVTNRSIAHQPADRAGLDANSASQLGLADAFRLHVLEQVRLELVESRGGDDDAVDDGLSASVKFVVTAIGKGLRDHVIGIIVEVMLS